MKNIYAYTAPSSCYPEYISVNQVSENVSLTVRSKPVKNSEGVVMKEGATSTIELSREQLSDFAVALVSYLISN